MREFNFGQPDELQASQLEDQRRMLAGLMAQSSQGPAFSGKAAVAKALTQVLAQMDMSNASRQQMALAEKRQAEQQAETGRIFEAAQNPGRAELARLLAQSKDPELRKAGLSMVMKGPGKVDWKDGGDQWIGVDESGRPTGQTLPKGVSPDTRYKSETVSADTRLTHQTPSGSALLSDDRARSEGAANRGVALRGQNLADERAREATAATLETKAAGAKAKDREDLDNLRKEYDAQPMVKAYKDVVPVIESAKKAADTPQGDLSLVYAVGKVLDPNSVVREGEMTLVIKSGSLLERMIGAGRKNFAGGGAITPDMRSKLLGMLEQRAAEYKVGAEKERERIGGIARQRGYDPTQIFGGPANGPKAGDVVDGFRFKGGDPNNQASWEPA